MAKDVLKELADLIEAWNDLPKMDDDRHQEVDEAHDAVNDYWIENADELVTRLRMCD